MNVLRSLAVPGRSRTGWLLLVALFFLAGGPSSAAQLTAARAAPKAAAPASDPVLEARAAFARGDLAALIALEPRTRHDPLAATVTAWRLTLQILRDDPTLDPLAVDRFLAEHRGTDPGERVRRALAQRAMNRGDWDEAYEHLTALASHDSTTRCWLAHTELVRSAGGPPRPHTAQRLLMNLSQSNEACTEFFQTALDRGLITSAMVIERYFATLFERGTEAARSWEPLLKLDGASRKQLHDLAALARDDPRRVWAEQQQLPELFRTLVARAAFLSAAKRGEPEAASWRQAIPASLVWPTPTHWQARLALAAEDWPALLSALDALTLDERNDRAWRFWRAWALKALGKGSAARPLFAELAQHDDFFGLFAGELLGQPLVIGGEPPLPPTARQQAARHPAVARLRALAQRGWLVEAQRETDLLGRLWRGEAAAALRRGAAALLADDGQFNLAIRLLEAGEDRAAWSLRYPTPWRTLVLTSAHNEGVDPAWAYGVMRQESRFRKDARSSSGALGLMQVMPATGQWLAKRMNERQFRPDHLLEPATNLRYGITYLRLMTEQLDGHPVLATGAYNAGPGRIGRLRQRHDLGSDAALLDALRYIELLPIDETRDYIRKVLANTVIYSHLLGQPKRLSELLLAYNDPTPHLSELGARLHTIPETPTPDPTQRR